MAVINSKQYKVKEDFDIQKVKQGDSAAFKRFFECLYPRLMNIACRFVDDKEAKDLVQDVFVDYWEKKHELEIANVSSYLFKSIQNKCLNNIKHQEVVAGYASKVKIALERIEYLKNTTDDNELFRRVSDRNIRELIEASVAKLPPKCQEAFRLCYFNELTAKEAAERMGISPRTVEGHLHNAVVHLREELRPLHVWLLIAPVVLS